MIRWLLAILLLANVGLFMWGSWYKEANRFGWPVMRTAVNPEKMQLISDPAVKATLRRRSQNTSIKTLQPVKRLCQSVGAFKSNQAAMRAGGRMKKVGLEYSLRTLEVKESRYQIYVPPRKSRKAAYTMQKKLSRLGFRDNALISDRGMRNAVSVGIFNVKENATNRRRALRKKGIPVRQRVLVSKSRRFWLDVPTDEAKLAQLKAIKWQQKGVAVKESNCSRVSAPDRAK